YSLRAFANSLSVDPSFLSKLIKGKRNLTPEMIAHMGKSLPLDEGEVKKFQNLEIKTVDSKNFNHIDFKDFQIISEWHFYAILELVNLNGFVPDEIWISKQL